MDIVIVAQYILDITTSEDLNSRFVYLANMLKENHAVEIVTSDFIHGKKEHVKPVTEFRGIKITMLHESGYKKNVCLRRFVSHAELAQNISKYLKSRKKPDVVYCAIPSTDVAASVARYCNKNNVKFIIDVQDLWPEAFRMVLNIPIVSDLLYYPISLKADEAYKVADAIVAVSNTYLNRVKLVNKLAPNQVVFLGTDMGEFDKKIGAKKRHDDLVTIVYIGSLEKSYDLTTAIEAVSKCEKVQLVVIGDGSRRKELECLVFETNANCIFLGYLPYSEMIMKMSECDIAINPIHKGSAGSIINKVGDYAMAGLPVINTQESQEYRDLVDEYKCGINCRCENVDDVIAAINILVQNEELRMKMSYQSRKLGETLFAREVTYQKIVDLIENI